MRFLLLLFIPFFMVHAELRGPRPPFVSGDGFRAHADFVFDEEHTTLDPSTITPSGVIFVKSDYLGRFIKNLHPRIPCRYILVTHNSDDSAPGAFRNFLEEDRLIAWFAQNIDIPFHPKLHPIPIGIANPCWPHGQPGPITQAQSQKYRKKHLLYVNFSRNTFPKERGPAYSLLSEKPFAFVSNSKSFPAYLEDVASSQFIASPRGNGLDTHRLWEALYLGSYPIVQRSTLDSLYEGLPVVVIEDWSQVTEAFLLQKIEELKNTSFSYDKLRLSYWTDLIDSYKEKKL
jgi:hypothetical protein